MHIVMTERAAVNGALIERGTVLDLPMIEAQPLLDAGHARLLHALPVQAEDAPPPPLAVVASRPVVDAPQPRKRKG